MLTLVAQASAVSSNGTTATSAGVDTTGATFLVVAVSFYNGTAALADSKGNTWTPITLSQIDSFFDSSTQLFYCADPVVGAGHTITVTATFPTGQLLAFSGMTVTGDPLLLHGETQAHFAAAAYLDTETLDPPVAGVLAVTSCGASAAATSPTLHPSSPDYAEWDIYTLDGTPSVNEELGMAWKETESLSPITCRWTHFAVVSPTRTTALALFRLSSLFVDGDPGTIPTFELTLKDDTVLPFSNHEGLNDRAEYYGGRKDPLVSSFRPIRRALSGSSGQLEHVRFGVDLIDEDRVFRALREDAVNRILTGRPVAVRTVSDADRRAELPMRLEMAGYVAPQYGARPGLNYTIECVDWLKARLARRNTQPEYWQETFSRDDFPLLPDAQLGKAMHYIYGGIDDEVEVDAGIYPRNSWDPGWATGGLGYNHYAAAGPPAGAYCAYVTVIKDGLESTLTPFQVGFGLDGSQQAYIYFRTPQVPDLYRVYFADGQAFNPFYNPVGTTFARYQDFDPNVASPTGCAVPDTDPFGNPNTEGLRYVLLDSTSWGSDYADIASSGGTIINAGTGPAPTRYIGEMTIGGITRSAFHVCRGAIKGISAAHLGGVKVTSLGSGTEIEVPFLGDYATVFGANYIDVNGRRHTIAFLTGQAAVDAISGSKPLTLSLSGYETVGDTSGDLITTPGGQLKHFADNFLAPATIPPTTWVVEQEEFPHIAGLPLVDRDSFDAVDVVHAARIAGGYETAGIIGEGGAFESAEDVIADFCKSGDFDVEFNRLGQLAASAEPDASPGDAIALNDVDIIDDGSFEILADGALRDFWNVLPFSHTKDMTSRTDRGWLMTGLAVDQDSIDNHGQRLTSDSWDLRFCRSETVQGAATVVDSVMRKQLRYREPIDRVKLAVPYLEGADIRNGSILSLDHVEGNGADGWEGHEVRVTAVEYQADSQTLVIDAYDMEPIYAGLPDDVGLDQTASGLRTAQTLVQLQEQVGQSAIDVTTIQAEIVSIDARVSALETGILRVLEEDPASPEDMTAWIVLDRATGLRSLRMYDTATGHTVDIASAFEPT